MQFCRHKFLTFYSSFSIIKILYILVVWYWKHTGWWRRRLLIWAPPIFCIHLCHSARAHLILSLTSIPASLWIIRWILYSVCVLVSVWLLLVLSQVQERERIRQEESEYLRQRSIFLCILYFVHDVSSLLFFLTTVACNHTSVHKYFQIYISIPINSIAILYII